MLDISLDRFIGEHEVVKAMLSSFALWGLGDIMAQLIERYSSKSSSTGSFLSFYAPLRTLRLCVYASLVWAPATHYWFQYLEHLFPGDGLAVAVKRMLLDQTVYAPLVISSLFIVVGVLEGLSISAVLTKTRDGLIPTLSSNWLLWPAAQLVLQGFVPISQRIFVANCINLPWTAYLAYRAAHAPKANAGGTGGVGTAGSGAGGGKSASGAHHSIKLDPDTEFESDDDEEQLGELID